MRKVPWKETKKEQKRANEVGKEQKEHTEQSGSIRSEFFAGQSNCHVLGSAPVNPKLELQKRKELKMFEVVTPSIVRDHPDVVTSESVL